MAKLFLPQSTLEDWALNDKADLRDGKLLVNGERTPYSVTPAVHFAKLVSGNDEKKLVSKVKTQEQLAALGVEQMMDSAILGESAYEVTSGYIAEVPLAQPKPESAGKQSKVSPESDLLASYLLDKL